MQMTDSMVLLEEIAGRAMAEEGENLKDTVVLHINHCMENSFYFSQILDRMFCRAVFVGVPYNDMQIGPEWPFIRYYGKKRGDTYELWQEDRCFFSGSADFVQAVEMLIERAVCESIMPYLEEGKRLLIFEDGGYHYPVFRRLAQQYPCLKYQVCGSVEQTASGTARCLRSGREYGYSYPCASMSHSDIKMYIESRFIGHRVVEELAGFLYTANMFLDYHRVLLLGYGIVGRQVAMDLKPRGCRIQVYDTDSYVAGVAAQDGFEVAKQIDGTVFQTDTIVIGNTGTAAFTPDMLEQFFHGQAVRVCLASSSSQDCEFREFLDRVQGKKAWPRGVAFTGRQVHEYYSVYEFEAEGNKKQIYLIAEGLPVNFCRRGGISLTNSVIDLIFSGMISMGLSFHLRDDIEKRLWRMGDAGEGYPYMAEEKLISRWFSLYSLVAPPSGGEVRQNHPAGEYLRRKLTGGNGEWKKNW